MRVVGSRITSACLYQRRHSGRLWRSLTFGVAAALAGAWHGAALDQAAASAQPVAEVQAPLVPQPPLSAGHP